MLNKFISIFQIWLENSCWDRIGDGGIVCITKSGLATAVMHCAVGLDAQC